MNLRRKIQNYFFEHVTFTHDYYGKIYLPKYNMYVPFDDEIPEIYNKNGELLKMVFARIISS